jgi:hypothetical protein
MCRSHAHKQMDLFGSSCHALLAQKVDGALQVSVGLHTMHRQTQAPGVSIKCRQICAPRMYAQIGVFAQAGRRMKAQNEALQALQRREEGNQRCAAACMCATSSSARLQSIIGDPVFSRSSFTVCADMLGFEKLRA